MIKVLKNLRRLLAVGLAAQMVAGLVPVMEVD